MKGIFLFCAAILFSGLSIGQVSLLDVNNIFMNARVNGDIGLEYDLNGDLVVESQAPAGSGTTFLFTSSLWMGGIEGVSSLHLAANTYSQSGADFWFGPVATSYDANYDNRYDRTWIITNSQIENHITNYGEPFYSIPEVIEEWPANGDTSNGESSDLAPYKDLNHNGVYEPMLGDHPLIRGDKAVYVIFNDDRLPHTSSLGNKIGVEVHLMMYAYESPNTNLDNTIFLNYKLVNRGAFDLNNFRVGQWVDWDLGNSNDDYVGCDVDRNLSYVYNGDLDDEGATGYGTNPPAAGLVLLNGGLDAHISHGNGSDPYTGFPSLTSGYYNYLSGKFLNGTDYIVNDSITTYMFPGTTDPTFPLLNLDENYFNNFQGDRRTLHSRNYGNFDTGYSLCLDYAMVFAYDSTNTNLQNLTFLQERVDSVQEFYNEHYEGCPDYIADIGNLDLDEVTNKNGVEYYFDNMANQWHISYTGEMNIDAKVVVSNIQGQIVESINWNAHQECILSKGVKTSGTYFVSLMLKDESISFPVLFK